MARIQTGTRVIRRGGTAPSPRIREQEELDGSTEIESDAMG